MPEDFFDYIEQARARDAERRSAQWNRTRDAMLGAMREYVGADLDAERATAIATKHTNHVHNTVMS